MAIDYTLELADEFELGDVRRVIAGLVPEVPWAKDRVTAYKSDSGVLVTAHASSRGPHVGFRLDKFADLEAQRDEMVRISVAVLALGDGDAMLHWETELVWLERRDGLVAVSTRDVLWPPERLALVPGAVRRELVYPE